MKITDNSDLSILSDRLLPDRFRGTSFEKLVETFLKTLNPQHNLMNNFLNQIDVDYIETIYGDDEVKRYTSQYVSLLSDMMNISYPTLILNGNFSSKNPSEFWSYTENFGTFGFSGNSVQYQYNGDVSQFDKLFQSFVFSSDKHKYEISFEVSDAEFQSKEKILVYPGTSDPYYEVNKNGKHKFRIDFNTQKRAETESDVLKFTSNISFNMKNIVVTEYERINTRDLSILASELVRNKGKKEAYQLLFDLLNNLGSQGNLDNYIKIDEFDKYVTSVKPIVHISEISVDVNSNIKYSELKNATDMYRFDSSGEYEKGRYFLESDSEFSKELIEPFIYKVTATFDEQVFREYIMPVVHPIGWEIIFDVFSLIELIDKVKSLTDESIEYRELELPLHEFKKIDGDSIVSDEDVLVTLDGEMHLEQDFDIEYDTVNAPSIIENYISEYNFGFDMIDALSDINSVRYELNEILLELVDDLSDNISVSKDDTSNLYDNVADDFIRHLTYGSNIYYDDSTDSSKYGDTYIINNDMLDIKDTLMVRYIRDWTNGSNKNSGDHVVEIKAISKSGVNLASGITPTTNASSVSNIERVTDGDLNTYNYAGFTNSSNNYCQIDLGSSRELNYIHVWHYYADNRIYNDTKVEISNDGVNWVVLFDSATEGTYIETSDGHKVMVNIV